MYAKLLQSCLTLCEIAACQTPLYFLKYNKYIYIYTHMYILFSLTGYYKILIVVK